MINKLQVIHDVCTEICGLDLSSESKELDYVFSRYIYFSVAKEITQESLLNIGKKVGRANHATVLHGLKQYNNYANFNMKNTKWAELYLKCIRKSVKLIYSMDNELSELMSKSKLKKEVQILTDIQKRIEDDLAFYKKALEAYDD
jgi:hypothetical protein